MRSSARYTSGLCICALLLVSQSAAALTNLNASMTVDNSFVAYLSTDDNVQGTQIGTGNNWEATYPFVAALTPGVTNYLHIVATDAGPPAMLIGSFTLNSTEFEFSNGTQSLLTNTADWAVSETGFGSNYVTPSDKGGQGSSPWGTRPSIDANAHFIWNPVGPPPSTVYFSTLIKPTGAQPPGIRTTFVVNKLFSDGNTDTDVTVHIQCFTGLPLNQQQTVSPDNGGAFEVNFVVESFEQDELDCDIWEGDVDGYTASYNADTDVAGIAISDNDGCHFEDIGNSNYPRVVDQNFCDITNTPDPVEVTINKDWVIEGSGGDELNPAYSLLLVCEGKIIGGEDCTNPSLEGGTKDYGYYGSCSYYSGSWIKVLTESGTGDTQDASYTADVIPDWDGGSDCWVEEDVYDSSVEVDGYDCGYNGNPGVHIEIGGGGGENECTVTNTVFFEGIPTLNQSGMAIMALLVLGVGFVGFRRWV